MPLYHDTLYLKGHVEKLSWLEYRNQVASRNGVRVADCIDRYLRTNKRRRLGLYVPQDLEMLAEDFRNVYRELVPHRAFDEAMERLQKISRQAHIAVK